MFKYKSNSRENQDLFVLSVLGKKQNGTYVEVGGANPIQDNNTYLLESEFGWTGVSLEWNQQLVNEWPGQRKNPCICADATQVNYADLFEQHGLGAHIDYLQLDIDPPNNTLSALKRIDFNQYNFSVITYEHDFYAGGEKERLESRQIIESYGYVRVIEDVMHAYMMFEDWYVLPSQMPNEVWKEFIGKQVSLFSGDLPKKYKDLFERLL